MLNNWNPVFLHVCRKILNTSVAVVNEPNNAKCGSKNTTCLRRSSEDSALSKASFLQRPSVYSGCSSDIHCWLRVQVSFFFSSSFSSFFFFFFFVRWYFIKIVVLEPLKKSLVSSEDTPLVSKSTEVLQALGKLICLEPCWHTPSPLRWRLWSPSPPSPLHCPGTTRPGRW